MFGIFKKKEQRELENWNYGEITASQKPEEMMGLREYISVDSMKAHLVDILEESRRLKAENEELKEKNRKNDSENRKKYELSVVEADEWRKREREAKEKIKKLQHDIDIADEKIEKLQQERNTLISKAEMAETRLKNEREERQSAKECRNWLERELNNYGNWEELTKSQLIGILKEAIKAKDKQQEEEA